MTEYASLRKIEFELCGGNLPEKYKAFVRQVLNDRNLIPAADVAPVVHGRWEPCFDENGCWRQGFAKCSNCGKEYYAQTINHFRYCSNCGAKMDGGADNGGIH